MKWTEVLSLEHVLISYSKKRREMTGIFMKEKSIPWRIRGGAFLSQIYLTLVVNIYAIHSCQSQQGYWDAA